MLSLFEFHELEVTTGPELGFAHRLIRCAGKLTGGKQVEDGVRATFCLRTMSGVWKVVHQHISMPLRMSGGGS